MKPQEYFLEGVNADDGTSASIDQLHRFMVVSGEKFELAECIGANAAVCISSGYMTFMVPKKEKKKWSWNDANFEIKRRCKNAAMVIESSQKNGIFHFYVDSSNRLTGWRHKYKTTAGQFETYEYLQQKKP